MDMGGQYRLVYSKYRSVRPIAAVHQIAGQGAITFNSRFYDTVTQATWHSPLTTVLGVTLTVVPGQHRMVSCRLSIF